MFICGKIEESVCTIEEIGAGAVVVGVARRRWRKQKSLAGGDEVGAEAVVARRWHRRREAAADGGRWS